MKAFLLALVLTNIFSGFVFAQQYKSDKPEKCSLVESPVKYKIKKGEHIAAVLRALDFDPIFGNGQYLQRTIELNNLKEPYVVSEGSVIILPIQCEEQLSPWTLQNANEGPFRWLTLVPAIVDTIPSQELSVPRVSTVDEPQLIAPKVVPSNLPLPTLTPQSPVIQTPAIQTVPVAIPAKMSPQEYRQKYPYRILCDGEIEGVYCISRRSVLSTSISGLFERYDGIDPSVSTNNEGLLLSRLNPEVSLGWTHYFNKNFDTKLGASFRMFSLLPEEREVPIAQDQKMLSQIFGEVRYEDGVFGYGLGLKHFDKVFYRFRFSGLATPCLGGVTGFSGCGVTVYTQAIDMPYVNFSWLFYQSGRFSNDLALMYGVLLGGTTAGLQIKTGSAYDIKFRMQFDDGDELIYAAVNYGKQIQNTSIELQTASQLGLTVGYAWKLQDW